MSASKYKIISSLGEGGQAHTFIARLAADTEGDQVVLKRLKNPKRIARFETEIKSLSRLNHPHVLPLLDHDLTVDEPYIITQYCRGGTLRKLRGEDSSPTFARAIDQFLQVVEGVTHAHDNGVIHRDIKPDNVFVHHEDGRLVLGDFGLCLLEDQENRLTGASEQIGSRFFMAPELADGFFEEASAKADVYSLGKLLYWILAGRVFDREKHRSGEWSLTASHMLRDLEPQTPQLEHVNRLLDKMLVQDPEKRCDLRTARDAARELRFLVLGRYGVIGEVLNRCMFCGLGQYRAVTSAEARQLGPVYNGARHKRFICTECGHVQLFLTENARQEHEWFRNEWNRS